MALPLLRQRGAARCSGRAEPGASVGALRRWRRAAPRSGGVVPSAAGPRGDSPELQQDLLLAACPVPREQQPIFQLQALQDDASFDLARQPLPTFLLSLAKTFGGFFLAIGLPVSAFTFDFGTEPAQCLLSAAAGSLFITTVLVWRLYLGWDHVGARLQSAMVDYEETGWYDGEVWVKPPEVLARDRLAFAYQIRPAVARLKGALLGLGGALAASVVLLAALPPPEARSSSYAGPAPPAPYRPAAAASALRGEGYEAAVARYEPWALEEEGGAEAEGGARPSLLQHMQAGRGA